MASTRRTFDELERSVRLRATTPRRAPVGVFATKIRLTDPDLSLAASLLLFGTYDLKHPAALNAPQFLSGTFLQRAVVVAGDQAIVPLGTGLGVEVNEANLRSEQIAS